MPVIKEEDGGLKPECRSSIIHRLKPCGNSKSKYPPERFQAFTKSKLPLELIHKNYKG